MKLPRRASLIAADAGSAISRRAHRRLVRCDWERQSTRLVAGTAILRPRSVGTTVTRSSITTAGVNYAATAVGIRWVAPERGRLPPGDHVYRFKPCAGHARQLSLPLLQLFAGRPEHYLTARQSLTLPAPRPIACWLSRSLGGKPFLAVQSIGDSHVTVYEHHDPQLPSFRRAVNNTTAPPANGNATGNLAWGATTINPDGSISQILYAMSTNQLASKRLFSRFQDRPPLTATTITTAWSMPATM